MEKLRAACALVTGILCLLFAAKANPGCASAFMEMDVLRKRAEKIPNGTLSSNRLEHEFRLIPDWNFTCNGSITSVLFGADIQVHRSEYPELQLWRRDNVVSNNFNKVDSREIVLDVGNFTPSGVFQYRLTPPMQFQSGDVLGIFHRSEGGSLVRLYYNSSDDSAPVAYRLQYNTSTINIVNTGGLTTRTGEYILLSLVTDPPLCSSGFLSFDALRQKALEANIYGVTIRDNQQRIFPDIHFTCSGNLIKWIVGGETGNNEGTELQIWRRSNVGENNYTKVGSSVLQATDPDNDHVYEYIPNPPLEFQEGDILGVYQRGGGNHMTVYYQKTTGPENYQLPRNPNMKPPAPDTLTGATLLTSQYDYPLVTVKIVGGIVATAVATSTTSLVLPSSNIPLATEARINTVTTMITTTSVTSLVISSSPVIATTEVGVTMTTTITTPVTSLVFLSSPVFSTTEAGVTVTTTITSVTSLVFQSSSVLSTTEEVGVTVPTTTTPVTSLVIPSSPILSTTEAGIIVTMTITTPVTSLISPSIPSTRAAGDTVTKAITTPVTSLVFLSSNIPSNTGGRRGEANATPLSTQFAFISSLPSHLHHPSTRNVATVIATVASIVVVLIIIVVVCIVLLAVLTCWRKSQKYSYPVQKQMNIEYNDSLHNPIYGDAEDNNYSMKELTKSGEQCSTMNNKESLIVEATMAGQYDQISYADSNNAQPGFSVTNPCYSDIVVPTMAQRQKFQDSCNMTDEELYSSLAQVGANPYEVPQNVLEDTTTYWQPGKDCNSIYEQLAQKKFREIFRQQIKTVSHIGSGQFGQVDKGVWHSSGGPVEVAIKTLKAKYTEEERVKFLQEAAIMGQFHHSRIVKLHGVVTVGDPVMIVLELMKNGDLRQYLHTLRPVPGELVPSTLPQQLLGYCRQIASGMEYLSKKSFVHRDLAARNILVDNGKTCKIADFGMSRDLEDEDYYVSHGGQIPIKWTAPEALLYKKYSTASDVWSFGVLMFEIWSLGQKPFEDKTNPQAFQMVKSGYRLPPPPGCTRAVYEIMIQCWDPETSGRPSFASLVSRLSQPENQLVKWTEEDKSVTQPQSTVLGAPLEAASNLHSDLQQQYLHPQ